MKILENMIRPNPAYLQTVMERKAAQAQNREIAKAERVACVPMRRLPVPKLVSRHLPHIGRKEMARHAGKGSLGPNASRVLQTV